MENLPHEQILGLEAKSYTFPPHNWLRIRSEMAPQLLMTGFGLVFQVRSDYQ